MSRVKRRKSRTPLGTKQEFWLVRSQTAIEMAAILILPGGRMAKMAELAYSFARQWDREHK